MDPVKSLCHISQQQIGELAMKCAMIGLGMVSGTYAQAILNSADVMLDLIYARTADSRDAFVQQLPDLGARAANNIDEIIASVVD